MREPLPLNTLLLGVISWSGFSNPIIVSGLVLVGGFVPLLIGIILPRLFGGWQDRRGKLFVGFSIGVLLSSFYDLMKETSGLSGSTLRTVVDMANVLALSLTLVGFYVLHSRLSGEPAVPLALAYLWALLGVGFHSMGEGIVAGYDFGSGYTILSVTQVLSFALHKVGEGFTVGTLLAMSNMKILHSLSTAVIGGTPVVLGALLGLGGLPTGTSTVFFAAAVGATIYFVFRLSVIGGRESPELVVAILLGFAYMYLSGVLHQLE